MSPTDTPTGTAPSSPVRRVIVASLIGTSLEWYDFFIYGTSASPSLAREFRRGAKNERRPCLWRSLRRRIDAPDGRPPQANVATLPRRVLRAYR